MADDPYAAIASTSVPAAPTAAPTTTADPYAAIAEPAAKISTAPKPEESTVGKVVDWFKQSFLTADAYKDFARRVQTAIPEQISSRMKIPEIGTVTPEVRQSWANLMGEIGLPQFAGAPIEAIPAIHNRILKPLADFAVSPLGLATAGTAAAPKVIKDATQAVFATVMSKQGVENFPQTVQTILDPKESAQNKWDSAAGETMALAIPTLIAAHAYYAGRVKPEDIANSKTPADAINVVAEKTGKTPEQVGEDLQAAIQEKSAEAPPTAIEDQLSSSAKTARESKDYQAELDYLQQSAARAKAIESAAVKLPDGEVKTGPEHDSIAPKGAGKDGFTTTKPVTPPEFVDRTEAMTIAKDAGQVPADETAKQLHSSMIEPVDIGQRPSAEEQAALNKKVEEDLRAQVAQRPGQRVAIDDTKAINDAAEKQAMGPTYGIANRVNEERAKAGYIESVEPGSGMSPEDLVQLGRDRMAAGENPEAVFEKFAKNGAVTGSDIGLVRAYGEKLAKTADAAADQFGVDSPQYKAARKADSDFSQRIQALKGPPSEAMRAMQGETEVDTGTFHGLQRAFRASAGRDFTPEESAQAQQVAAMGKKAKLEDETATQKWEDHVSKGRPNSAYPKQLADRLISALDKQASEAMARITARRAKGQAFSGGINPEELDDYVIYGASKIAKGVLEKGRWAAEMVKDFGDYIKPHLDDIWQKARAEVTKRFKDSIPADARAAVMDEIKGTSVDAIYKRTKLYIDQGIKDPAQVISKVATDSGLTFKETLEKLTADKTTRRLSDEMWAKMSARRTVVSQAKRWLEATKDPALIRYAKGVPDFFFNMAIMGHGTVWSITHGGVNYFIPQNWNAWVPNFFRSFKLMGLMDNGAYHEQMMQNMMHSENYVLARRSGLKVDPYHFTDDYQNSWIRASFGRLGLMGNRGFDGLKLARMALWDNFWKDLPDSQKTPAAARVLSAQVNHLTGAVDMKLPGWLSTTLRTSFFAPTLEASRWMWLYGDPARAAKTFLTWDKASEIDKTAALREARQKLTWAGVYLTSLAANQGFLTAAGSDQKINFTDPTHADWLAFKVAGHKIGFFSPVIGTMRFVAEVAMMVMPELQPKNVRHNRDAQDQIGIDSLKYLRGKLSPFGGTVADFATRTDYSKRPLPFGGKRVPPYMRRQGVQAYTWPEYASTKIPIPFAEAAHEIWQPMGMDESMVHHWLIGLGAGAAMGTTGVRVSVDTMVNKPIPLPEVPK